jgi:hypothetical protein
VADAAFFIEQVFAARDRGGVVAAGFFRGRFRGRRILCENRSGNR